MNPEEELIQFAKDWDRAMENNDVDEIGKFMSDDWIIVGTSGGITSKSEFLGWIKSGEVLHTRMDSDFVRVKIYENTGVLTSRGTSAGKYKGQDFELYEWSASTFIRANSTWVCVQTMLTPAEKT
ncbi:MAG TPA: nuclear transport factor 2 family protein [Bacteroidia bacterium]|nr:nuclear transport factor 2 family protein [Bacteroidia bacterium]